jgi:hypothetical protein
MGRKRNQTTREITIREGPRLVGGGEMRLELVGERDVRICRQQSDAEKNI